MRIRTHTLIRIIILLALFASLGYLNLIDIQTVSAASDLTLTKTDNLNPAKYDQVGQVVGYTLTATNNGNVTLHNVTVSDAPALADFSCTPTIPVASLAPGTSVVCTGTHTITQADLNAGSFVDTGSATSTEADATDAPDTILATQNKVLGLTKTDNLNPATYDHVGQVVGYTLTATNNGNVTLHNVTVSDAPVLASFSCNPAIPRASLAPGASVACTGTHTITQADLDAGSFADTGSATSTEANATNAPDMILATQNKVLSLTKVATELNFNAAGTTLHYTLVATNDGNATLTGVSITDAMLGTLDCIPAQPAMLVPGANLSCTGTYLTTQANVNAGKVDNTANASGMLGLTPVAALPASKSVPATLSPALTIKKTATPAIYDHAGQMISYSFTIVNSGNVTISAPFTVFDDKATNEGCPLTPAKLDPGEFITCTASYTILFSDMTSGMVINSAYATGKFGETTITSNTDTATITAKKILTYTFLPSVGKPYPTGVQILPVSYSYESHNTLFIIGEVLNNTSDSLAWVKVSVNIFDNFGKLVGTKNIDLMPPDLPAREKGCFKIDMPVPLNWVYYQFETPTYAKGDSSSKLSIITDSGSYDTTLKDYSIIGQVRNDGNLRSNSVYVSGTVYNVTGVPVGCSYAKVNSNDLDPGQISSFSIKYLGYYRDYIDVAYYRLRVAGDLP